MKRYIYIIAGLMGLFACGKTLDQTPQGVISGQDLNTPENVEKMVIAAYSGLGNDNIHTSFTLWPWGSMRSGDAYKGGDSPGDNTDWYNYEIFSGNRPELGNTDEMWYYLYIGISRANDALRRLNKIDSTSFPNKRIRQAETRFIRGHFYFMLKVLYKRVPFIDEIIEEKDYGAVSNVALSNDDLWNKIADDFRFGVDNLPETQPEIGRANKFAATAYLAKTLLYQAYVQDDKNNVVSVDTKKLNEVLSLCDKVITSGKYELNDDFAKNFLAQFNNSRESVFAVQFSKNDGTPKGRLNMGVALNYPMNQEFGCCGFHLPSQDLVNAFKTDNSGLPMFDHFNDKDAKEGADFTNNSFDPRLDHTVAIPGHPYKYSSFIYQKTWARAPQIYGYFSSLKETVAPDDPSFQKIPPFMSSSKNSDVIRFDDVLLWKAEALIQLNRQDEALPIINAIRARAKSSTGRLKYSDGTYYSNYKINSYQPGVNCNWTKDFAWQALIWERRLEFAMEGNRFFDLVRWGIAAEYLNHYFTGESSKRVYLKDAKFTKNKDEYLPVPLNQLNYSRGVYKQNTGW
ncbi:RagB/SusD family nutrient uptake outer membrane protein [Chitinophaga silvatica]|uniref:RagB/SusD family nutrient uptake outer membrane protein n=1 Tax=Chitinophaga silvatica TaxID=2282649 RepID=A0A3E1Y8K5_9BACT|nr:RagB/SusD family nutrient uptake outer membrane protein [Chitinophaga silvatica]RFS21720.1 RagB/SusD family nutrient uptake outer membrane protein [Chitinophaga silvatica]